jgi:polyhydroxybutyrate depolymerase
MERKYKMKIFRHHLFSIFAFILLISTTACGQTASGTLTPVEATATPAPTATVAPTLQPSETTRKVTVDGVERSYLLHIPPGVDNLHAVPLVFAFHGAGEQPTTMQLSSSFDEVADKGHFVLVYPEGLGNTWNAGGKCCGYALINNVDDEAFVREMLSDLGTVVRIDTKRIYATGFSNGALLTYRLACDMSDVFAAIAPVAGTLAYSPCEPEQPVSVLHVQGMADRTVPYEGGGQLGFPPLEQVIATWVDINDCPSSPTVDNPIEKIKRSAYTPCKAGTAIEVYAVESGGHGWVSKYVYPLSETIWDFFAAHPKP